MTSIRTAAQVQHVIAMLNAHLSAIQSVLHDLDPDTPEYVRPAVRRNIEALEVLSGDVKPGIDARSASAADLDGL